MLSDCSRELYVNTVAARHLRRWGRKHVHDERFWVRSEWEYVDISFGHATTAFDDWDRAYDDDQTGDFGILECKVCYDHLGPPDATAKIWDLAAKLKERERLARTRKKDIGALGAMVWWVSYEGRPPPLKQSLQAAGFSPIGTGFVGLGAHDLSSVWPMNKRASTSTELHVGLFVWSSA